MHWLKQMAAAVIAVATLMGSAHAGDGFGGRHGGNGGQGPGYRPGLNVYVDVPMSGLADPAAAAEDRRYDRCRDVRHSCFGEWGVEEPGYGRCMRRAGC